MDNTEPDPRERWRRIEELYHAALDQPADGRSAFLAEACANDLALRAEVQSLLRLASSGGRFLETPPFEVKGGAGYFGAYEITGLLGTGGMAEVYRARDGRLGREVAIKVLPAPFATDRDRVARFEREARLLASLNHPHIAAIHGLERTDGHLFLVLELVDGPTLAEHLVARPLPVREALELARQIAQALEAAHERGIVHRDLKPANIKITADGTIKLLDFGLAKALVSEPTGAGPDSRMTVPGLIVGTVAYMSPEQARGQQVDRRADIWAFGCVLYELLVGRRAFSGDTASDTLAAVLTTEPQWSALPPETPPATRRLLLRCLQKDPARRQRDIGDARLEIEQTLEPALEGKNEPPWTPDPAGSRRVQRRRAWLALVLWPLLLVAGYVAWQTWPWPQPRDPLSPVALTTLPGAVGYPSFSPDGSYVTFMWNGPQQDNPDIYVQQIGAGGPLRRTTDARSDFNPVWSPDGRWIAFLRAERLPRRSAPLGRAELWLIAPLSGSERVLGELQVRVVGTPAFLAWCPDSSCLIVTDSPGAGQPDALFVLSLETGERRQLTRPPASALGDCNPAVSRDGVALVFRRVPAPRAGELYRLPLGKGLIASGDPQRLTLATLDAAYPAWLPDGKGIVFSARGSLWRLAVPGKSPAARLPFVGEDGTSPTMARLLDGSVRLVYVRSASDSNVWRVDAPASGASAWSPPVLVISSTRKDGVAAYSPDGQRVAFTSDRSGEPAIWTSDPDGSNAVKLTSLGGPVAAAARWSPDGESIAFQSNLEGQFDIYVVAAKGGRPRRITSHPANDHVPSFSRDGQWIYFGSLRTGDYRIWKTRSDGGGDPQPVTQNAGFRAIEGADGRFLYYTQEPGGPTALWRIPTIGGQPVRLLDGVIASAFEVVDSGVYYVDQPADQARLRFFDFATARSITLAEDLGEVRPLLSVSPDGRTILYSRVDSSVEDLMLVDGFR